MSRLEIILSAILFLSIGFNIGIFIYARAALARLLFVSEELGDLQHMVNALARHLKSVYELEMFYGCLLYTSPSPRDRTRSRMPSSA